MVLVIQMKGAALTSTITDPPPPVDLAAIQVGQYDVVKVTAKTASAISVAPALKSAYRASGAQVVRVPQYTTVSVPDATSLTAAAWDGTTGGIVAFVAQGAVMLTGTGTVHADAKGFRGGVRSNNYNAPPPYDSPTDDPPCLTGGKGESFDDGADGFGATACGVGARGTGGGGGGYRWTGGGGGGNGGPGGKGSNDRNNTSSTWGGYPGAAVGANLIDRLTLGGGGGGGQNDRDAYPPQSGIPGRGGSGGGIVWFRSLSLAAASAVHSNGQRGPWGQTWNTGRIVLGPGGAGAGGSVVVRVVANADCSIEANGGTPAFLGGSVGGAGRVRLEARGGTCPVTANHGDTDAEQGPPAFAPGAPPGPTVEDAGGVGFGCVASTACAAANPICDPLVHVCRACKASSECATTGYCAADGRCTAPPPAEAGTPPSADAAIPPMMDASSSAPPATGGEQDDATTGEVDAGIGGGGCRTAPNRTGMPGAATALAIAAVAMTMRRRRRRRR